MSRHNHPQRMPGDLTSGLKVSSTHSASSIVTRRDMCGRGVGCVCVCVCVCGGACVHVTSGNGFNSENHFHRSDILLLPFLGSTLRDRSLRVTLSSSIAWHLACLPGPPLAVLLRLPQRTNPRARLTPVSVTSRFVHGHQLLATELLADKTACAGLGVRPAKPTTST